MDGDLHKIDNYIHALAIGGLFDGVDKIGGPIVGGVRSTIVHTEDHFKLFSTGSCPGHRASVLIRN